MADTLRVSNLYSSQVGIGTTNPNGPLHVNASTSTSGAFGQTLIISNPLGNAASRPAISAGAANTSIWATNTGGTTADDGFLRIAAGGGTGATIKSYIDISGYSTIADMDRVITFGTAGAERIRINSSGNVGIGTTTPGYALHVVGAIFATGNVTAYSDQRYKQNIIRLNHSLDAIRSLSGYSYTRLDYLPGVRQIGLLAQEVKEVLPEAVSYDSTNDIYSVNYNCLMAPVVEAIKELYDRSEAQAAIIQAQQLTIQRLTDRLESL